MMKRVFIAIPCCVSLTVCITSCRSSTPGPAPQPSDTTAPVVSIVPPGGLFNEPTTVHIEADEPATIFFTVDGGEPDQDSDHSESPVLLLVDQALTVRAFAVDIAGNIGETVTAVFTYAPTGCNPVLPTGGSCNPRTGYGSPLPTCTLADPCTEPLASLPGPITKPTEIPACRTSSSKHPSFDDGAPSSHVGIDGTERYACEFVPSGASSTSPRPLLLFFHGSGGTADDVYDTTLLRQKADSYDLSGDPQALGFVLVSVQGRNLHWPNEAPQDGSKHDIYYRDFSTCSTNPDFAEADRRIDAWVATGLADPSRIYVSGWSNGARFAQAYAIARHGTPTPGGNRVAAAAVYSGADPFNNTTASQVPSCQLAPYPQSTVPILIISGWCDWMPCDAEQLAVLSAGTPIAPGSLMSGWVSDLATKVGNPNATWVKIRGSGSVVNTCMPVSYCTSTIALQVHLEWPDGIASTAGGEVDHEPDMLDFLRDHPLHGARGSP